MGKFTSLAVTADTTALSPEQSAALAAAESAVVAQSGPAAVVARKNEGIPQAAPLTPDPAQVARVEGQTQLGLDPNSPEGVRELAGEEKVANLQTQLEEERVQRGVITPTETGYELNLPNLSMRKNGGALVSRVTDDVARTTHAANVKEGSLTRGPALENVGLAALAKVGMAQESAPGRGVKAGFIEPSPQFGGAAYLATLMAVSRLKGTAEVATPLGEGETQSPKASEGGLNRIQLANMVGEEFEQLVRQSPTVNPETGVASEAGYESALSPADKAAIGDLALITMEQAGLANEGDIVEGDKRYLQKRPIGTGAGRAYEYNITEAGWNHLQDLAPTLETISPGTARPVSLTPTVDGRFVGEKATRQKEITRTPEEGVSVVTPTMQKAMDVMGTTPNMISNHKLATTDMMLTDVVGRQDAIRQRIQEEYKKQTGQDLAAAYDAAQGNPEAMAAIGAIRSQLEDQIAPEMESPFAVLFGQDHESFKQNIAASQAGSRREISVRWHNGGWVHDKSGKEVTGDALNTLEADHPSPEEGETVKVKTTFSKRDDGVTHRKFAQDVRKQELQKAQKTLGDAKNRDGQVFYYGATAIGNSSRLMISQTELNPQANKLARFMVDNPRATIVTKGGDKDGAFRYVIARAIMNDADTFTPKALVDRFNSKEFLDSIRPAAQAIYQGVSTRNPEMIAEGMRMAMENKGLADEWEATGEWGFVFDGLHEWGRYLAAPDGAQVPTRVKAEADGINNGSSIQGLQFGSNSILKRAGVIYDPEGETVIPEGNMRKYVWDTLMGIDQETGERVGVRDIKKEDDREFAAGLLDTIGDVGLVKKFIKIPLMTTIYGKPYDRHGDHAKKFVIDNVNKLGISIDDIPRATSVLTKAISNGLFDALDDALLHQDVIKHTAGWFWNMTNTVPQIEGANGFIIQAGGHDYVEDATLGEGSTIRTKYFPMEKLLAGKKRDKDIRKESELTAKLRVPSATAAKRPERKGEAPSIGNITRNQLAVSGTHNIDATVAQETLIKAADTIPDFWGQQVFDAFIGDVNSFEKLIDIGNEKFVEINDRYNMVEMEYKAYKEQMAAFKEKAKEAQKNGEIWDASKEGEYKGLYAFAKRFINKPGQFNDHGKFVNLLSKYNFQIAENDKGQLSVEDGPVAMTPMQVVDLVTEIENNFLSPMRRNEKGLPVRQAFEAQIRDVNRQRQLFKDQYSELIKFVRQFN